jgi:hypothetical protein
MFFGKSLDRERMRASYQLQDEGDDSDETSILPSASPGNHLEANEHVKPRRNASMIVAWVKSLQDLANNDDNLWALTTCDGDGNVQDRFILGTSEEVEEMTWQKAVEGLDTEVSSELVP